MGINAFPCKQIDRHTIDRYIDNHTIDRYIDNHTRQIEILEKGFYRVKPESWALMPFHVNR